MDFYDADLENSWNFVAKISWQPWNRYWFQKKSFQSTFFSHGTYPEKTRLMLPSKPSFLGTVTKFLKTTFSWHCSCALCILLVIRVTTSINCRLQLQILIFHITRVDSFCHTVCFAFQSEPGNLQKKFSLTLDAHDVGELGYEVTIAFISRYLSFIFL